MIIFFLSVLSVQDAKNYKGNQSIAHKGPRTESERMKGTACVSLSVMYSLFFPLLFFFVRLSLLWLATNLSNFYNSKGVMCEKCQRNFNNNSNVVGILLFALSCFESGSPSVAQAAHKMQLLLPNPLSSGI